MQQKNQKVRLIKGYRVLFDCKKMLLQYCIRSSIPSSVFNYFA